MSEIANELRQRTLNHALRIIAFCRDLPDTWQTREIGRQLLRAGMGVAGNYWSACRGRSDAEFIAKLGVATDEAEETVLWVTALLRSGIRSDLETKALLREGEELRAILSKSARTARENRRRRRAGKSPTHQSTNSPTSSSASTP